MWWQRRGRSRATLQQTTSRQNTPALTLPGTQHTSLSNTLQIGTISRAGSRQTLSPEHKNALPNTALQRAVGPPISAERSVT
jgi:hypothetical protein